MGRRVQLFGHRGACAELPENTLASFDRAIEVGVTTIESDIHQTVDGHIVMSHDESGQRMANIEKRIRDCPLEEVQAWDVGWGVARQTHREAAVTRPFLGAGYRIPALADVLERYPDTPFNLDVKQTEPSMVAPLIELLREHGAEPRVTLASFHPQVLEEIRKARFGGALVLGQPELRRVLAFPRSFLDGTPGLGHRAQVPVRYGPIRFGAPRFINKCHSIGLFVDFWTINEPTEAVRLAELGADGIMTDDPARIAPALMRAGFLDAKSTSAKPALENATPAPVDEELEDSARAAAAPNASAP